MYKYDTSQVFLYGDVEEELYVRAPDWWPELVPEGYCMQLRKNIYGTRQAARAWHIRLSTWMEEHEYLLVNNDSEKTIFMKWEGEEFILIGVFVDDFSAIPTTQKLKKEFETLYAKDFDVTGGKPMKSFLGLVVEQGKDRISLHLDTYILTLAQREISNLKNQLHQAKENIAKERVERCSKSKKDIRLMRRLVTRGSANKLSEPRHRGRELHHRVSHGRVSGCFRLVTTVTRMRKMIIRNRLQEQRTQRQSLLVFNQLSRRRLHKWMLSPDLQGQGQGKL
jgi:hypothetical protein